MKYYTLIAYNSREFRKILKQAIRHSDIGVKRLNEGKEISILHTETAAMYFIVVPFDFVLKFKCSIDLPSIPKDRAQCSADTLQIQSAYLKLY